MISHTFYNMLYTNSWIQFEYILFLACNIANKIELVLPSVKVLASILNTI